MVVVVVVIIDKTQAVCVAMKPANNSKVNMPDCFPISANIG
jgi:hypothetical protein